jgi:pyruvate dehydrogenase E2 component (dihydrolipoamide acetyltransferase)
MTDCTERAQRSEGREGMPGRLSMTERAERNQGMRKVGRA